MPILSITRREAMFEGVVNETISSSPQTSKPHCTDALAASVANPSRWRSGWMDQPTSTAGSPSTNSSESPT
jgi:hypothetical protein